MNTRLAACCLVAGALMLPVVGHAADLKSERSSSEAFVKDSVITAKIKTALAEEKLASLVQINVDTDSKGKVTLGGTAANQNAVDKAVSIARAVEGVTTVENHIQIAADK